MEQSSNNNLAEASMTNSSLMTPPKRIKKEPVPYTDTSFSIFKPKKKTKRKSKSQLKTPSPKPQKGGNRKNVSIDTIKLNINLTQIKIDKLKLAREKLEKVIEAVKFPLPDELIPVIDHRGKRPVPLPESITRLNISEEIVSDVLVVWDFLFMFSEPLELYPMDIDDFVKLLNYSSTPSIALTEICCALLKVILNDERLANKITYSIPKYLNFAYISLSKSAMEKLTGNEDLVDANYNGLGLLPKSLSKKLVTPLNWQALLRCLLLRLPPAKVLRDAVGKLSAEEEIIPGISSPVSKKQQQQQPGLSSTTQKRNLNFKNIDILHGITSQPAEDFEVLKFTALELQKKELHELEPRHKILLLKLLCLSCYDTEKFRSLLETHAEERSERIAKLNKMHRDEMLKKKEVSATKRAQAFEACRKINKLLNDNNTNSATNTEAPPVEENKKKKGKTSNVSKAAEQTESKEKEKEKSRDPNDPTPSQLQQMLDDMLMLDSFGVDEVELNPPDHAEIEKNSDDEADAIPGEFLDMKEKIKRRRTEMEKKKDSGKTKILTSQERKQLRNFRADAVILLEQALATKTEKAVKNALKVAKNAGFRWTTEDGKEICTDLMKKVYRVQYDLEQSAKEATIARQHEKELVKFFVRTVHLGMDRHFNRYFCFEGDHRVFVEQQIPRETPFPPAKSNSFINFAEACEGLLFNESEPKNNTTTSNNDSNSSTTTTQTAPNIYHLAKTQLIKSKPYAKTSRWFIYASESELYKLCECLDERGERERALKTALKARFDIKEPTQEYLTTGHDYIGKRVVRDFGKNKHKMYGTIVGWLPAEGNDPEIWHIQHLDGDEEDLEKHEIVLMSEQEYTEAIGSVNILPDYCNKMPGITPIKKEEIGINGLKNEMLRFHQMIIEGFKLKGLKLDKVYSRDGRRLWESTVRNAETISELRVALQTLETTVRDTQSDEDLVEEEESRKEKEKYRETMRVEGWLFKDDPHGLIGKKFRRFIRGLGKSDGFVVAYLPGKKSETGKEVYYFEHDSGDQEDVAMQVAMKAVAYFEDDETECDEEDWIGDIEGELDDNMSLQSEDILINDDEDDDSGDRYKEFKDSNRLWPSRNVRDRWLQHLHSSKTVAEVALAFSSFIDHVNDFESLAPDPLYSNNPQYNLWGKPPARKASLNSISKK